MLPVSRISTAPISGVTMQARKNRMKATPIPPRTNATANSMIETTSEMVSKALAIPRCRVRRRASSSAAGGTSQSRRSMK